MATKENNWRNSRVSFKKHYTQPTKTDISQQKKCDVKQIMLRYRKTGILDHVTNVQAIYGDFSTAQDFQAVMQKVANAHSAFEQLPAKIRDHFKNDPKNLIEALEDKKRTAELTELGIIMPKTETPPTVEPKDTQIPSKESTKS